jgi:hypothetical protein
VAKPAIGGINGGNAYVAQGAGFDVNKLTEGEPWNNLSTGNFLVTTVNKDADAGRPLSSLTKNLTGEEASGNIASIQNQKTEDAKQLKAMSGLGVTGLQSCVDFGTDGAAGAGACSNAKTLSCNSVAQGPQKDLKGVRTVLVKNGDLTISADTAYGQNSSQASWAWIAENGNVVISKDVSRVAGVVMALCADPNSAAANNGDCGRIISDGTFTSKQLVIDGALYGDVSDLVEHRTYVRGLDPESQTPGRRESLTVGTVIKYSNRSLKCAPPLLEKFIERYQVQKVAR